MQGRVVIAPRVAVHPDSALALCPLLHELLLMRGSEAVALLAAPRRACQQSFALQAPRVIVMGGCMVAVRSCMAGRADGH